MPEVAVVVGAGGGIGAACAVALSRPDRTVLCVDRDPGRAEQTADRIRSRARTRSPAPLASHTVAAVAVVADAAEPDLGEQVLAALPAQGTVTAAVHAVAHEEHCDAVDVSVESVLTSFRVGPVAAFSVFRALVAADRCPPGAALTVISSLHRDTPFRRCLGYNAAHAALGQVVTTLAHEWAPRRIRVNGVAPGWINTPGEEQLYGPDHLARAAALLPFGVMGTPEHVADAVAFLSTEAAAYVSGTILTVDGALSVSLARLPGEPA